MGINMLFCHAFQQNMTVVVLVGQVYPESY